jgi:hypothetical protein
MYDADVSASLISKVTDAVIEQVTEWQNRALDSLYPVVYLDCIVVKVRQHSNVINKSVYLALGINMDGQKRITGYVDCSDRRCQILAVSHDRAKKSRSTGHSCCLPCEAALLRIKRLS